MYLDFAATSPISKIWIDSIINSNSKGLFGNPGSYHEAGFSGLDLLESSTKVILQDLFDHDSDQYNICYNSGSTESINQFLYAYSKQPKTLVIYENVAHKAVLKSIERYFPDDNFMLQFDLTIEDNIDQLKETLNNISKDKYENFVLVLTSVNNETGGIWNKNIIEEINEVIRDYKDISYLSFHDKEFVLFLDHTQGFMKHNKNLELADAFCFSAHKIGGMKGFGGLVYKKEIENILKDNPLIVGGYDIRGGTKDPISVKALSDLVDDFYVKNIIDHNSKIYKIYGCIINKLVGISKECKVSITFNQHSEFFSDQSPYIINASFVGIEGESLMSSLINDCISTGSACNSSELKTSHVLSGLGIKKLIANCAFRISLSDNINQDELEDFLENRFKPAIKFLSRMRTRHGED